ncbi:thiaminase/transcriptional activator TenA [Streptomyces sp. 1114.5]|uniref:thiaminase II n=1 Tax=unclassified Streptomyces TaxID=2593676 RepID=UPI000BCED7A7|nr:MULTISPECIES: thiaminase II [unclassified Streptomyces]RKT16701.1 thiaminase/transcriptional activator TenA [Streptomyces sp. 1114.5]SOB82872.1 thiaminase /4-amino-5-aminomethyl-2-methylpyrimidine deaminase [Streptomyces sp. 1331.2]
MTSSPGSSPTPSLTEELWASIESIHAAILAHPFIHGLTDGTLPREAFRHFVVQDSHYLRDYARALAVCAAKAPTEADVRAFADDAIGALAAEQGMHAEFMTAFGGTAEQAAAEPVLPTTRAYTSYLLATVHGGSFAEAVGAVLPCYWIYARVGEALLAQGSPDPLYAKWIATYGDEAFQSVVRRVLALTDRIGEEISPAERRKVVEHFVTTSRYEWMFWDAAWRGERWPV